MLGILLADLDEEPVTDTNDEDYEPEVKRRASSAAHDRPAADSALALMPALPEQEPGSSAEAGSDIGPASLKKRSARTASSSSFR
jgi:hypothetical protein